MLTSYAADELVVQAIKAGAAGYLLKQSEPERLFEAIRAAAHGQSLLDPDVTRTILTWLQRDARGSGGLAGLAPHEERIVPLPAEGKTNREIGAPLGHAENTVKSYVSVILRKFNLSRRGQVSAFLARRRA
jgi:two-component system, NarL family, response regulator DevR